MTIQEINNQTTEGRLLLFAIRLRSIENDCSMEESLRTIEQVASMTGNKPAPVHKPFDLSADLQQQVRHWESEYLRMKEAFENK